MGDWKCAGGWDCYVETSEKVKGGAGRWAKEKMDEEEEEEKDDE